MTYLLQKGKCTFTSEQSGSFRINQMVKFSTRNSGPTDISAFGWGTVWSTCHLDAFLLKMFNLNLTQCLALTSSLKEIKGVKEQVKTLHEEAGRQTLRGAILQLISTISQNQS